MSSLHEILIQMQHLGEFEFSIRKYSGRGMYGKKCLGITFDGSFSLIHFGYELGRLADEDFHIEEAFNYATDSMGLGTILYWPNIEFNDVFEEDSEFDDDDEDDE